MFIKPSEFVSVYFITINHIENQSRKMSILKRRRRFLGDLYKKLHGCTYCNSSIDLVFHHFENKISNVASLFGVSYKLWKEVYKCEVVCKKCHKKIHERNLIENIFCSPYWIICIGNLQYDY